MCKTAEGHLRAWPKTGFLEGSVVFSPLIELKIKKSLLTVVSYLMLFTAAL